jgi:hypothetical protein
MEFGISLDSSQLAHSCGLFATIAWQARIAAMESSSAFFEWLSLRESFILIKF